MEWIHQLTGRETAFLLVLARMAAFVAALPAIGDRGVPMVVKALAALSITFVLFPVLRVPNVSDDAATLTFGLLGEALIGAALGLGVRFFFAAVDFGSDVMGLQMGLGIGNLYDPAFGQPESLVGRLFGILALMIFFIGNVHHVVLRVLVESFERVPLLGFTMTGPLADQLIRLGGGMFVLALMISFPVTVAMLLATLALGILFRVVPQMNVFLISFPVTISLGLLVTGASVSLLVGVLQGRVEHVGEDLQVLLSAMRRP
ncbi:MAG TPA: flagellar biosynthetic protein FliR [Nitrospiria bacterium]|nr:flagellar biosynthetic protein FliR [Nitrospiria bacterium]